MKSAISPVFTIIDPGRSFSATCSRFVRQFELGGAREGIHCEFHEMEIMIWRSWLISFTYHVSGINVIAIPQLWWHDCNPVNVFFFSLQHVYLLAVVFTQWFEDPGSPLAGENIDYKIYTHHQLQVISGAG